MELNFPKSSISTQAPRESWKVGAVSSLDCEHLVVGAGLLGLATADHLLRRGAQGVLVLERAGSPNGGRPGLGQAILRNGDQAIADLEEQGRLYLESGHDYLDSFLESTAVIRRVGSLRYPADLPNSKETEILSPEEISMRFEDQFDLEESVRFCPRDGSLDTLPWISALYARVRAHGGRFLFDHECTALKESEKGVHFTASGRSGIAQRASLASGVRGLRMLESLGIRHSWHAELVHTFQLRTSYASGPVLWLPSLRTAMFPTSQGEWTLEIASDMTSSEELPVDWALLEEFRGQQGDSIRFLSDSEVRRAHAYPRLALSSSQMILKSREGRVAVSGPFGPHALSLFSSAGELLAKHALQPLSDVGGILEEF